MSISVVEGGVCTGAVLEPSAVTVGFAAVFSWVVLTDESQDPKVPAEH